MCAAGVGEAPPLILQCCSAPPAKPGVSATEYSGARPSFTLRPTRHPPPSTISPLRDSTAAPPPHHTIDVRWPPRRPQSAAQAARAGRAPGRSVSAGRSRQVDLGKSISAGRSRRLIDSCGAESKRARPAGPCGAIGRAPGVDRTWLLILVRARGAARSRAVANFFFVNITVVLLSYGVESDRPPALDRSRRMAPSSGGRTAIAESRLAGMRLHPLTSLVAHPRARERSGAIAGGGEFLFREYHGGAAQLRGRVRSTPALDRSRRRSPLTSLVAHPRARERSGAIAGGGEFLFREYHGGAAQLRGRVRSTPALDRSRRRAPPVNSIGWPHARARAVVDSAAADFYFAIIRSRRAGPTAW